MCRSQKAKTKSAIWFHIIPHCQFSDLSTDIVVDPREWSRAPYIPYMVFWHDTSVGTLRFLLPVLVSPKSKKTRYRAFWCREIQNEIPCRLKIGSLTWTDEHEDAWNRLRCPIHIFVLSLLLHYDAGTMDTSLFVSLLRVKRFKNISKFEQG